MLRLVFLISFATVLYGWDWSDDDYVVGTVGKWVDMKVKEHPFCEPKAEARCTSQTGCCWPRVCWMDGHCREKLPEYYSIEGYEYVTGKAGQYQRYDGCNNARKRRGEYCNRTSECCFPLDCRTGLCMMDREDTDGSFYNMNMFSIMSAGFGIPLKPGL